VVLSDSLIAGVRKKAAAFWKAEVVQPWFIAAASGKEIGHRIADPVDDKTTGLLLKDYEARFQRNKHGEKLPRSMGDIWLKEKDIFHAVNIKSCVTGTGGRYRQLLWMKVFIRRRFLGI
jgi:hypothetical protein